MSSSIACRFGSVLLVCTLAVLAAGCGRGSMVGRRVDDFSAFYNKFYNARKAFDEATDPLGDLDDPVDPNTYLPVFVAPTQVSNEDAFAKAVKKSADLLRTHPGSKWVDDALLLIGKSYYYQENYVGAEQKFREVIERGSPLASEARFWVGRALVSGGDLAAAGQHLRRSLSADSLSGQWAAQMRLLQGDLRVRTGAWPQAARALAEGLGGVRDGQARARAFFLRGQVLEAAGRYDDAARSYQSAARERPRYELAYAAEASALRTGARTDAGGDILRRLERMERDDKNESKLADLALLRGELYQAEGRSAQARRRYRSLLYPGEKRSASSPVRPSSSVKARAHYALATLYRDAYDDFTRAAAHFDTASTRLSRGGRQGAAEAGGAARPTVYAITDSRRQAERYGRVAEASEAVARLDSLLRLGRMDPSAFETFIDSVRRARTEAAREVAEKQARRRAEQGFGRGGGARRQRGRRNGSAGTGIGQAGNANGTSLAGGVAAGEDGDTGFLFYRNPVKVQQSLRSFRRRWGDRPRVPNWRRRAAISTRAETEAPGDPSDVVGPDEDLIASTGPPVNVSAVPRTPARLQQMRTERAAARYDLGNALLLSASRPDSAAVWFRRVIEENADPDVARRARYALAEAERAAGRSEAARSEYRRVAREQQGTPLARRAQQRLSDNKKTSSSSPEAARAEKAYTRAYHLWQGGGAREEALQQMLAAAASYPEAATAPRALLAAARIFIEWAHRTDRPLATPLPARPPDSLRALLYDSTAAATTALPDSASADSASADSASADSASADSASADSASADSASADSASADSASADSASADSASADSVSIPSRVSTPPPLTLERLLDGLARRYPETPHADRARRMLAALRKPAPGQSAGASPADSVASDTTVSDTTVSDESVSDSTVVEPAPSAVEQGGETKPDSSSKKPRRRLRVGNGHRAGLAASADSASADSASADSASADSASADSASAGQGKSWVVVIASKRKRARADSVATRFRERHGDMAVRLLPAKPREERRFRVVVGPFATRAEAEAARRRPALPPDSWVLAVPPRGEDPGRN